MDPLGLESDVCSPTTLTFGLLGPAILEGGHAPVDVQGFSTTARVLTEMLGRVPHQQDRLR